jgi:glycosyltransferase involved in cell wall biosynthesis
MAGWIVAQLLRRPFLLEVSDLWPESVLAVGAMQNRNLVIRGLSRMAGFLYNRADRIVVLTEAFRKKITSTGVPEEKIDVILNGVDLEQFRPCTRDVQLARQWGIQATDFVVGYIGTLGMAHGLENVLRAAEYLDGGRVRFLFVGPGAEREHLQAIAVERGLKNVVFVPPQLKEEMPRYWSLCDVALVHLKNTPLFATVIPSKLFEAMGMGLPIVLVAPQGEASKIVSGENVGLHVPAGHADALATALTSIEKIGDGLKEISDRSRFVAQNYSRERQARLYLTSLERASGRGPVAKENTYEPARL